MTFAFDSAQIVARRGPKAPQPTSPIPAVTTEQEPGPNGQPRWATTVFLFGKECPFRCLMCDLWKSTRDDATPPGSLVQQLASILPQVDHRGTIKLYNASNFFDPRAVPTADRSTLAEMVADFQTVVVENHPKLLGPAVVDFAARLGGRLQVAMGLETSDPNCLQLLNKQMTVADYDRACRQLKTQGQEIRTFLLLPAPGVSPAEMERHTLASVRHALAQGSDVTTLIPLRGGNGALDELVAQGQVHLPDLETIVATFTEAVRLGRSAGTGQVVLLDLWDMAPFSSANDDLAELHARLQAINLRQDVEAGRNGLDLG